MIPEKKRIDTLAIMIAALVAAWLFPAAETRAKDKERVRPNILFILTDDQAAWALGAAGNRQARTPNMDRLCREGARLTNAFVVTPVCSPSRAALITSRYSTECEILDYLNPRQEPQRGLGHEFVTWPQLLSEAGYATALVGKWHLGQVDDYHPTKFGYQDFVGFRVGGLTSKDPDMEVKGRVRRMAGYTPDILTDHAIDFLRRHKERPFLLSLHYWAPHANTLNYTADGDRTWLPLSDADWDPLKDLDPLIPNPDYPKLDVPRVKRMMREYLASVASADRNLGRLLEALDRAKLAERTVVIFTSDHGYNMGHNGIWHKGNGRWILTDDRDGYRPNLYDNSLRVPAIVRYPRLISAGTVVTQTVTTLDWYPTILAMAGVSLPAGVTVRGRNFLPLLERRTVPWDNAMFAQYSMRHGAKADLRTWRTPQWKLIRDFRNSGRDELYDLARDPGEYENLIDSQDAKVRQMQNTLEQELLARMRALGDPVLLPESTGK